MIRLFVLSIFLRCFFFFVIILICSAPSSQGQSGLGLEPMPTLGHKSEAAAEATGDIRN